MFEDVAAKDDVERFVVDLVPYLTAVDVPDDDSLGPRLGDRGGGGIELDAGDLAPSIHHCLGDVARRAAEFEDRLVVPTMATQYAWVLFSASGSTVMS